jgi:hypothetical protein
LDLDSRVADCDIEAFVSDLDVTDKQVPIVVML